MAAGGLARLQLELEYDLTPDGLLVPCERSPDRDLCCIYVDAGGIEPYFRFDVPPPAQELVRGLDAETLLGRSELLVDLLGGSGASRYETYVVPAPFPPEACPEARLEGDRAVVRDAGGALASWAYSIRESDRAAECAVETAEAFRKRGYAAQATATWANRVLADGKIAFYSHLAENDGSCAVAAKLGLEHVFTVVGVSE